MYNKVYTEVDMVSYKHVQTSIIKAKEMSNNLNLKLEIFKFVSTVSFSPNPMYHACTQVSSNYLKPSMSNQNIDQSHRVLKSSIFGFCSFFFGLKCHKSLINHQLSWMLKKKKVNWKRWMNRSSITSTGLNYRLMLIIPGMKWLFVCNPHIYQHLSIRIHTSH